MCLVHDVAEIIVGDLTPHDAIKGQEKHELERAGMLKIAPQWIDLFDEYEQGTSEEAQFVKTMDKLDMGLQAMNYQHQGLDLSEFIRALVQERTEQNTHPCLNEVHSPTRTKTRTSAHRLQPDGVVVHHGGFWSRRPRFESESGYFPHTQLHQSLAFRQQHGNTEHRRSWRRTNGQWNHTSCGARVTM